MGFEALHGVFMEFMLPSQLGSDPKGGFVPSEATICLMDCHSSQSPHSTDMIHAKHTHGLFSEPRRPDH